MVRLLRLCVALVGIALLGTHASKTPPNSAARINSDNYETVLGGTARKELDALSEDAKDYALTRLDELVITTADRDSLHFDKEGNPFFIDTFLPPKNNEDTELGLAEAETEAQLFGSTDSTRRRRAISDKKPEKVLSNGLPILHSKPKSRNVVFLDFDGDSRSSSVFGSFKNDGYNPRGRPGQFDSIERSEIVQAWARVAEDYAPFDVDITTEEPKSWNGRTLQCLIANSRQSNGAEMPASYAGGYAMVGIFNRVNTRYLSPALVYWNNLNGGRNDYVGECISHEVGHNLGLSHDGQRSSTYFGGDEDPDDPVSWGPIMGSGYLNSVSQWSSGHYDGANNREDDIGIITSQLGRRGDETGSSAGSAKRVKYTASDFSKFRTTGIIGTDTDHDWWEVDAYGSGRLQVTAKPWQALSRTLGGNLDIKMRIINDKGKVLKTVQPWGQTIASTSLNVGAGKYFIDITGDDDPYNYPFYGSIGQYNVQGSVPGLSRGKLVQVSSCGCRRRSGQTSTKTRRRFQGGLVEFCIQNRNGSGAIWAQVRSKPDNSSRWGARATTKKLFKRGQKLCAYYRAKLGEDKYKHELRIKKEKPSGEGLLRY